MGSNYKPAAPYGILSRSMHVDLTNDDDMSIGYHTSKQLPTPASSTAPLPHFNFSSDDVSVRSLTTNRLPTPASSTATCIELAPTLQPVWDSVMFHASSALPANVQAELDIEKWTYDKKKPEATLEHLYEAIVRANEQADDAEDASCDGNESDIPDGSGIATVQELEKIRAEQDSWATERASLMREQQELREDAARYKTERDDALSQLRSTQANVTSQVQLAISAFNRNQKDAQHEANQARGLETWRIRRHWAVCKGRACKEPGCRRWRVNAKIRGVQERKKLSKELNKLTITGRNDGWDRPPLSRASRAARPSTFL